MTAEKPPGRFGNEPAGLHICSAVLSFQSHRVRWRREAVKPKKERVVAEFAIVDSSPKRERGTERISSLALRVSVSRTDV